MKKQARRTGKREKLARDMTMRDIIALATMHAITRKRPYCAQDPRINQTLAECATSAYKQADAMIRAREVKP